MHQVDEVERGAVQALRRPLGREHDGHVARGGQAGRLGGARPVVKPDRGAGRLRPDGREGRGREPAHREPEAHEVGALDERASTDGGHVGRSAPREHGHVGVWSDDRDGPQARGQGQVARVLEEHRALLGHGLGDGEVRGRVDGAWRDRVVVEPDREDRAHDPVDHVVEPGLGHLPCRERVLHPREVQGAWHLHVEAGHRGGATAVGPVPVGHDEARKRPVLLQDAREERLALGAPCALHEVVAGHHRLHAGVLHPDLEREQVGLAGGALVDDHVHHLAPGLLVVEREVLDGGDDVLVLRALDVRCVDAPGQDGIFALHLVGPAVARLPSGEVHVAAEVDVDPVRPHVLSDHHAVLVREIEVPGGGARHGRRQRGGLPRGVADPDAAVHEVERGEAHPVDPGDVACRTPGPRVQEAADAVNELQLLVLRHGADEDRGALVGAQGGGRRGDCGGARRRSATTREEKAGQDERVRTTGGHPRLRDGVVTGSRS